MADAGAAEDYEDDFEEYDEEADAKWVPVACLRRSAPVKSASSPGRPRIAIELTQASLKPHPCPRGGRSSALPTTRSGPSWPNIEYSDVAMGDKLGGGGARDSLPPPGGACERPVGREHP